MENFGNLGNEIAVVNNDLFGTKLGSFWMVDNFLDELWFQNKFELCLCHTVFLI